MINMDYLMHTLHLREDVARTIYKLQEGDQQGCRRCLEILEDPSVSRHKDPRTLLCLTAKLNGDKTVIV